MDETDRRILACMSSHVPVTPRPFLDLAEELGMPEQELMERVRRLKDKGVIRRIGAVLDPARLGWVSTLCAAHIPLEKVEEFARIAAAVPEITHNYLREGTPNCWFTIIAPTRERINEIIRALEANLGVAIQDMPSNRVFKIRVAFGMER